MIEQQTRPAPVAPVAKSKGRLKRIVFTAAKIAVAGALLTWVLAKVHWHDFVELSDGRSLAVMEVRPGAAVDQLLVRESLTDQATWRPASDFQAVPGQSKAAARYEQVRKLGVASALERMDKLLLALACLGFLISWLIIAVRWWFLLKIQDIRISLWEAVRLTFLGQFFSVVVPGTVGGDLVKAYYVSKHTTNKAAPLVSVFVDRVLGMTELVVMATVMLAIVLIFGIKTVQEVFYPVVALAVCVVALIGAFTFLLSARFRKALHLDMIYRRLPIAHHIAAAGDAANLYRKRLGSLIKAIGVTLGSHVVWIASIALIGMSLHIQVETYNYFLYVPLIYIVGAVPITPGGAGVVESLYTESFRSIDPQINLSLVLVLALLARLMQIFWSIPGAIVAITGPKLPKAAQMEAEMEKPDPVDGARQAD